MLNNGSAVSIAEDLWNYVTSQNPVNCLSSPTHVLYSKYLKILRVHIEQDHVENESKAFDRAHGILLKWIYTYRHNKDSLQFNKSAANAKTNAIGPKMPICAVFTEMAKLVIALKQDEHSGDSKSHYMKNMLRTVMYLKIPIDYGLYVTLIPILKKETVNEIIGNQSHQISACKKTDIVDSNTYSLDAELSTASRA